MADFLDPEERRVLAALRGRSSEVLSLIAAQPVRLSRYAKILPLGGPTTVVRRQ